MGEQTQLELDYFVVDVFTDRALAGNPLAVVMNTCGLTAEQMQAIAREFNLSETTFVERRAIAIEQAEGVRVRIFTTQEELQFAGHPTLGTASVLKLFASEPYRGRHGDAGRERGTDTGTILRRWALRRDDAGRSGVWRGARCSRGCPPDWVEP